MILQTERLTLKPLHPELLDTTFAYAGAVENAKMMVFLPHENREETARFLENAAAEWKKEAPNCYEFGIFFEEKHIGGMTVYIFDEKTTELGWILHRDYWNRGFVTEAAKAAIDFSVNELGRNRIIACCDSENPASYRVMEKLGMHLISKLGGRKNRSSDDERIELTYELIV